MATVLLAAGLCCASCGCSAPQVSSEPPCCVKESTRSAEEPRTRDAEFPIAGLSYLGEEVLQFGSSSNVVQVYRWNDIAVRLGDGPLWTAPDVEFVRVATSRSFGVSGPGGPAEGDTNVPAIRGSVRGLLVARTEVTARVWLAGGGSVEALDSGVGDPAEGRFAAAGLPFAELLDWCDRNRVRLPTEEEWSMFCACDQEEDHCIGVDNYGVSEYAWSLESSMLNQLPVACLMPSYNGLYDVHGGVWELVEWDSPIRERAEGLELKRRTQWTYAGKGGSFAVGLDSCSASRRGPVTLRRGGRIRFDIGFRVVRSVE